jgi:arginase
MRRLELIGIEFDGYGRTGNQTRAASALRQAGLVGALRPLVAAERVDIRTAAAASGERGADTSLINEAALLEMAAAVGDAVVEALDAGRIPFCHGGDCSALLGVVPALRDRFGAVGLVHVDGHEDTMPLDVSEDGEAANAEIGLLLGITGKLLRGPLAGRLPALEPTALALLGQKDDEWRGRFGVMSLVDRGVWKRDAGAVVKDPVTSGREAAEHVRRAAERWWLHVDVDVLDPLVNPAQGFPDVPDDPGGLTWEQLTSALTAAVQVPGCVGWSTAIYDPDQDPDGTCGRRLARLVGDVSRHLAGVT